MFFALLAVFFLWGITDENFRLIVFKPDNVPITALLFLVPFFPLVLDETGARQ